MRGLTRLLAPRRKTRRPRRRRKRMARPWLFRVDFNDVGGRDGRTIEVLAPAAASPDAGDRALLVDAERNRCLATVRSVEGRVVNLRVDPETWTEPVGSRSIVVPPEPKPEIRVAP